MGCEQANLQMGWESASSFIYHIISLKTVPALPSSILMEVSRSSRKALLKLKALLKKSLKI